MYTKINYNKPVGVYWIFSVLPVWAVAAILFAITELSIMVGRDILEGMPYQVAYSALVGDAGLIICVLIAADIVHNSGWVHLTIPYFLRRGWIHEIILFFCVAVGVVVNFFTIVSRSGKTMDTYHDVVVAPLILYFAITLIPVIYYNGKKYEKYVAVSLMALWLILVYFDIEHNRMNQRQWLADNYHVVLK